jgi:hypothetical protein
MSEAARCWRASRCRRCATRSADLRHELANVRAQIAVRDQDIIGIANTITDAINKLPGWTEKTVEAGLKRSEAEMCSKIAEKFGELMGRLAALDPMQA